MPAELFKTLNYDAIKVLHQICQQIWKTQQWPQNWKRSILIPVPKKCSTKECSNHWTIALIFTVKASAYNARGLSSITGSGRSPGEGNGNPLQYSCLENSVDGEAWQATGPPLAGVARELDTTWWLNTNYLDYLWKFLQTHLLFLLTNFVAWTYFTDKPK